MYVCIYRCMYVYIYTDIYIYMYIYNYEHMVSKHGQFSHFFLGPNWPKQQALHAASVRLKELFTTTVREIGGDFRANWTDVCRVLY